MRHIGDHLRKNKQKANETERGELMRYFCDALNRSRLTDGLGPITMGRMGKILQKIPTKDLYYLKKVCDDSTSFSKKFWWLLNPKNHVSDAEGNTVLDMKRN